MIVLQHIVPSSGIVEGDEVLYSVPTIRSFPAEINGMVDFRTHFNLFPAKTVRELSSAKSAFLEINFEGNLEVTLYGISEGIIETVSTTRSSSCTHIDFPLSHDLYGVTISGHGVLKSASFCVDIDGKTINLALCICTYRMENTVRCKMNHVRLFLDKHPELQDCLKIYITDNGRTLDNMEPAIIIPSDNLGGSGGFTRSILEAIHDGNSTHIVLNDDDALLDPEILFRTWSLLRITNREDLCILGTALDIDKPYSVIESGASLDRIHLNNYGRGLSVSSFDGNLAILKPRNVTYGGWWFTAFPVKAAIGKGLPLPLFLKMDDAEYGTRLKLHNILTCGISIWHKTFASKYNPINSYYYVRNMLASSFTNGTFEKDLISSVVTMIHLEAACMRYDSADEMIAGLKDFMKGPDFVFTLCTKGIRKSEPVSIQSLNELHQHYPSSTRREAPFRLRKYTLNGQLLPAKGGIHCEISSMSTKEFYRAGYVVFQTDDKHGFVSKKKALSSLRITLASFILGFRLKMKYNSLMRIYTESKEKWTSEKEWMNLLGMKSENERLF